MPEPKRQSDPVGAAEPGQARLERLARRYYAPLVSFFRKRTRNPAEVEDLVQQVFVRLAQYPEMNQIRNADGFIFQTAANALKDHARHARVRERVTQQYASSGTLFAERLAGTGAKVRVPTTLNVGALDLLHGGRTRLTPSARDIARRTMSAYIP